MFMLSTFRGAALYEFRMQVHRLALWIPFGFVLLAMLAVVLVAPQNFREALLHLARYPLRSVVINWTNQLNSLLPLLLGVLLADRLPRDRKTRVDELLATVPGSLAARLTGKYLGTMLATMLPILLIYGGGLLY